MNILIVGSKNPEKDNIAFMDNHVSMIKKVSPHAKIIVATDDKSCSENLKNAEIIIHSHGRTVSWDKAPNLKWVHSGSAGVTDLAIALRDTEVKLTNSSGVHPIPISEWVLGAMLFFAKKFDRAYRIQITKHMWERTYEDMKGFELSGKTIGIVGYGRIGSQIGKLAKAIGMKVLALENSKKLTDKTIDKIYKDINYLLSDSDFVVNSLPLTEETEGYFDADLFRKMMKTSYFLNIGRGKTVVENDLIKALKEKIIMGAALDVTETEPLPSSSPLWKLDNILITPHISSWTPQYTDRLVQIFCINLKAYLQKKPMPNIVDKNRGY